MATFIGPVSESGTGVRVAIKDLIDIEGRLTTAGCRAIADGAEPAGADAICLRGCRDSFPSASGVRVFGESAEEEAGVGGPYEAFCDAGVAFIVDL